jgi:predicted ATPase
LTLWCLGYTAEALARSATALERAHELNHPYSIVIALTYASILHHLLDDPLQCQAHAEAASVLAGTYDFTLWLSMVTFLRGWAKTKQGDTDGGFADMQRSIDLFRNTGAELGAAYSVGLLAEAFGRSGSPDAGLLIIPQAFDLAERTQDRWAMAELHRLQGELHLLTGDLAEAEAAFQAAIATAQAQQARQWALRAAVRLSQLWQEQNKPVTSSPVLAELYTWFGERNDTPDLRVAKRHYFSN